MLIFVFTLIKCDITIVAPGLLRQGILLRCIADALWVLLPCVFLRVNLAKRYAIVVTIMCSLWGLMQEVYFKVYGDLMPFSSLLLWDNITPILIDSFMGLLRPSDILFVILSIFPIAVVHLAEKKFVPLPFVRFPRVTKKMYSLLVVISSVGGFVANAIDYHLSASVAEADGFLERSVANRYKVLFSRFHYVCYNGYLPYVAYQIFDSIREILPASEQEIALISHFLQNSQPSYTDSTYAAGKGKNLVFIIVESLNAWAVDIEISGRKVCPTLSFYSHSDSVISMLKVCTQVAHGHSSDGRLIYNTGLLPMRNDIAAVDCGTNFYYSIARALGYHSIDIVGDDKTSWNQETTSKAYGFDSIYDKSTMTHLKSQNEVYDARIFAKATELITPEMQASGPFMALITTLTMHQPYNTAGVPTTWISQSSEYSPQVLNYLERAHFFDLQLSKFLQYLKNTGIFQNSIIVIASDHNDLPASALRNDNCTTAHDKDIVCLIIGYNRNVSIDRTVGQIDIYPTILDVMGANDYVWKGLGNSVLREPKVESAVPYSGIVVGSADSPLVPRQCKAWEVSDAIIKYDYFRSHSMCN